MRCALFICILSEVWLLLEPLQPNILVRIAFEFSDLLHRELLRLKACIIYFFYSLIDGCFCNILITLRFGLERSRLTFVELWLHKRFDANLRTKKTESSLLKTKMNEPLTGRFFKLLIGSFLRLGIKKRKTWLQL